MFLATIMFFALAQYADLTASKSNVPIVFAGGGGCSTFADGNISNFSSTEFTFSCDVESTVYFGVCDSGNVPNDDEFTITYNGEVVSFNRYVSGAEYVNVGSAIAPAGTNTALLNSVNAGTNPPATFSYAVSTDSVAIGNYLGGVCGIDYGGPNIPSSCSYGPRDVPVFTEDTAPSNGTLEFHVLIGNEGSRSVEGVMQTWDISQGQQLNNVIVPDLPDPRWGRLWWQADGSTEWYLLTSQYWSNDGTTDSEYGIECKSTSQPSYHTSFASAVPESAVCFDLVNGCN